jgi:hypothetical protein
MNSNRSSLNPTQSYGSRPTDRGLPPRLRTRAWPFLLALIIVAVIGIGLLAFGSARLGESTQKIESNPHTFDQGVTPSASESGNLNTNG